MLAGITASAEDSASAEDIILTGMLLAMPACVSGSAGTSCLPVADPNAPVLSCMLLPIVSSGRDCLPGAGTDGPAPAKILLPVGSCATEAA